MVIYIDYDGVMADTMAPSIKEMKEQGLYDTEEGRTKYYRELKWKPFLERTGFIDYVPWIINRLIELEYKVVVLTHCNSLNESEDKCIYIKSSPEIKNPGKLNIISVPRKLDKTYVIEAKGNVLWDDRIYNIETWNKNGGIGVVCAPKEQETLKTISNPLLFLSYVTSLKYTFNHDEHNSKRESTLSQENILEMKKYLLEYKDYLDVFLIYDKLVKDGLLVDESYNNTFNYINQEYARYYISYSSTNRSGISKALRDYYGIIMGSFKENSFTCFSYWKEFTDLIQISVDQVKNDGRYMKIIELLNGYNHLYFNGENNVFFSDNVFDFPSFSYIVEQFNKINTVGISRVYHR